MTIHDRMLPMSNNKFPEWLEGELKKRGWRQVTLAVRAGLSTAAISRIMSGENDPTPTSLAKIAEALGYPLDQVYRAAGLIKSNIVSPEEQELKRLNHMIANLLSKEERRIVTALVESLIEKKFDGEDISSDYEGVMVSTK